MPRFYRIVQSHWAATAFTGEGARTYGGRWNTPGIAAVYLAESRALAALETVVHAPREALMLEWFVIGVEIEDSLIDVVPTSKLPDEWRMNPSSRNAQYFGAVWLQDRRNLGLLLPSVIIPEEKSLLLNPSHPAMRNVRPEQPELFSFDPRLSPAL